MYWFWEDARGWLADRGVYLYETNQYFVGDASGQQWLMPLTFPAVPAVPPYAVCVRPDPSLPRAFTWVVCQIRTAVAWYIDSSLQGRNGYAQDAECRDMVIRLVQKGSDHYRIFQRLLKDEILFRNTADFPCVIPPVAVIDPPHKSAFAMSPRCA